MIYVMYVCKSHYGSWHVLKVLELILFADDTNVFFSDTDASYLMEIVNLELNEITCRVTPGAFLWH